MALNFCGVWFYFLCLLEIPSQILSLAFAGQHRIRRMGQSNSRFVTHISVFKSFKRLLTYQCIELCTENLHFF
jgi:hypothetical protein